MKWFVPLLIFVMLTFGDHLSEANHNKHSKKKLPSVVIVGKVYCDTCFQEDFDKTSHIISGASVAVECKYGSSPGSKPTFFRGEAKTDKSGRFRVALPFSVSKHVERLRGCSVKLVRSGEPYCAVASTAARSSSLIRLESRRRGTHIFSAGFFTFKPLNQPTLCNQKPSHGVGHSLLNTATNNSPELSFPPPLKDPTTPTDFPPLPSLPIPDIPLPDLTNLPALPTLPSIIPNILPSIPPIISSTPRQSLVNTNADQKNNVHTQNFNFFPPNNPNSAPSRLIPDIPLPHIPITLPTLPRLPSIPNLPPIITSSEKTKTALKPQPKRLAGETSGHHHHHHHHRRPRVDAKETFSFPPNPFQPPPLVPNPFQPTPPSLVPNPFQPTPPAPVLPNPYRPPAPPTPLLPFPTLPGLTPSPPPPTFPFLFPPFPFPTPRVPGTPPAS